MVVWEAQKRTSWSCFALTTLNSGSRGSVDKLGGLGGLGGSDGDLVGSRYWWHALIRRSIETKSALLHRLRSHTGTDEERVEKNRREFRVL